VAGNASSFSATIARLIGWQWVHVTVAALAMVATRPGRTHDLGLFTEAILKEFDFASFPTSSLGTHVANVFVRDNLAFA
jgi:hypothetical protein